MAAAGLLSGSGGGRRLLGPLGVPAVAAICSAHLICAAAPAASQEDAGSLLARQEALFEALEEDPTNLELMFDYAAVALRREDYEAAIAVLERMLFYNPDLPRVKLELAVAYYRLGAYDVARFHFEDVLADEPPEAVAERIAPFLDEIGRRTAISRFDGSVTAGLLYSSNATLGPLDRQLRFEGGPLFAADEAAPDFGARLTAAIEHSYDLRTARDDAWITTATYTGLRYREETSGDLDAAFVTTGPRLALDAEAFGLKARPYLEGGVVRSGGDPLYALGGIGVEAIETLDERLTVYGGGALQWREFVDDSSAFDGLYAALSSGFGYALPGGAVLRFGGVLRTDRAAEGYASNVEGGLLASISTRLPTGETVLGAALSGDPGALVFAQASHRSFDEPDDVVDPDTTRRDLDLRMGARLTAPIHERVALVADVSHFERRSSIENYALRNFEVGLSVRVTY